MSRIRSVHPGFFTDERLVACSAFARLLFIGLGVEADDKGIFEWKPLTIKMLVFPGDNIDIVPLLDELRAADAVRQFDANGKSYGAIRNFRVYQRPKTPNDIHPITGEVRNYVGLKPATSEPFPPIGEKSPQMEDVGGRVKGEEGKKQPPAQHQELAAVAAPKFLLEKLFDAANIDMQRTPPTSQLWRLDPINALLEKGYNLETQILPPIRDKAARSPDFQPSTWGYYLKAVQDAVDLRAALVSPKAQAEPMTDEKWRQCLELFKAGTWHRGWGPKPGEADCRVPAHLLAEIGVAA